MTVRADYASALAALAAYRASAIAAQNLEANSAIVSVTLAAAATSAAEAIAKLKGDMGDERTGNLLNTLVL